MAQQPGTIHRALIELFTQFGVNVRKTVPQLRTALGLADGEQRQFERRLREVRAFGYDLRWDNGEYWFETLTCTPVADTDPISGKLRAEVLNAAHGRCQMCGKTIQEDGIKLVADHRVPRTWGGETARDNLWAICQECNISKRDFFASLDANIMRQCMQHDEPIRRIAELFTIFKGKLVPRRLLEVVAEGQDEWPRRVRELRELGWEIEQAHDAEEQGKYTKAYRLKSSKPLPDDLGEALRKHRRKVYERLHGDE